MSGERTTEPSLAAAGRSGAANRSPTPDESVRPIRIAIPQEVLDDLRERLDHTRWPDRLPGAGWDYGAEIDKVQRIHRYWSESYDWRVQEGWLNSFPNFVSAIDGQDLHFVHQRSSRPRAIPLILIHGWPGSFVEFLAMVEPLCEPQEPSSPAFHVVVPSLPGFGLSGVTRTRGWDPARMARSLAVIMERLGYDTYGVHGGDWGSRVGQHLAAAEPERVVAFHSNLLIAGPPPGASVDDLTANQRENLLGFREGEQYAYFRLQETRPQALAFALMDSPTGLLAWFVDKFHCWVDHDGDFLDVVDRDAFLTNLMMHWATGTVGSAMRIYRETALTGAIAAPAVRQPVGYAAFPRELVKSPESWVDHQFNVVHRGRMAKGGHFAALEQPMALVEDIRQLFMVVSKDGSPPTTAPVVSQVDRET